MSMYNTMYGGRVRLDPDRKLSAWQLFMMQHKGQKLTVQQLSEMYRQTHTVQPKRSRSPCYNKNSNVCRADSGCTWVVPKKPTRWGTTRNPYCTISRKTDRAPAVTLAPPPTPVPSRQVSRQVSRAEEAYVAPPPQAQYQEEVPTVSQVQRRNCGIVKSKKNCNNYDDCKWYDNMTPRCQNKKQQKARMALDDD